MQFGTCNRKGNIVVNKYYYMAQVTSGNRPRQIVLGNFLATFFILSDFLANEQLRATFPKVSILLATLSLFEPNSRIFTF